MYINCEWKYYVREFQSAIQRLNVVSLCIIKLFRVQNDAIKNIRERKNSVNLQVSKLYSEESTSNNDSEVPKFANALPHRNFLVGAPITGKNHLNFPAKISFK